MADAADGGTFRPDRFSRLNAVELRVPPLRGRREDILAIAAEALADLHADGVPRRELSPAAARHAGLSWKHFRHKMREFGIRPDAWTALARPPR